MLVIFAMVMTLWTTSLLHSTSTDHSSKLGLGHPILRRTNIASLSRRPAENFTEATINQMIGRLKSKHILPSHCRSPTSFQDIKRCFPLRIPSEAPKYCRFNIQNWKDVQNCLNHGRKTTKWKETQQLNVKTISLIGERNSGTKFLVKELQECFKDYDISIRRDFSRPKHWFQKADPYRSYETTLLVAIFRDPVEWAASMREKPYHAPNHIEGFDEQNQPIVLGWEDFVGRRWTLPERPHRDLAFIQNQGHAAMATCHYGFAYHELMPCIKDKHPKLPEVVDRAYFPVYELSRNSTPGSGGTPYDNILQLRSDKILNFLLEIPLTIRLGGYLAVRYEDLVTNGTRSVLEQVSHMIGLEELPRNCTPQVAQRSRLGKRHIPESFRSWIMHHLNPEVERLLGYPFIP